MYSAAMKYSAVLLRLSNAFYHEVKFNKRKPWNITSCDCVTYRFRRHKPGQDEQTSRSLLKRRWTNLHGDSVHSHRSEFCLNQSLRFTITTKSVEIRKFEICVRRRRQIQKKIQKFRIGQRYFEMLLSSKTGVIKHGDSLKKKMWLTAWLTGAKH